MTKDELIPKLDQLIQSSDQFVSEDNEEARALKAGLEQYIEVDPECFYRGFSFEFRLGFPLKTCGNDDHD